MQVINHTSKTRNATIIKKNRRFNDITYVNKCNGQSYKIQLVSKIQHTEINFIQRETVELNN